MAAAVAATVLAIPAAAPPLAPAPIPQAGAQDHAVVPQAIEVIAPAQPNCWPPVGDLRPLIHASYAWEGPPQWPVGLSVNSLTPAMRMALSAFPFAAGIQPDLAVEGRASAIFLQDADMDDCTPCANPRCSTSHDLVPP